MAVRNSLKAGLSILFCVLLMAAPANAGSEGFVDLYLGAAGNCERGRQRLREHVLGDDVRGGLDRSHLLDGVRRTVRRVAPDVQLDRPGRWTWGTFQADGPGVDITGFPMTLLLALRAPLFPTPDRPGGRLQPYAMAGVSFYITDISVRLDGMGGSSFQSSWPWPNTYKDTVVGPYLAAGLAWQPMKSLAIFGEYRYTSFDVDFDTTNSFILPTANGRVETTIRSDRLLFGLSYRFGADAPRRDFDHPTLPARTISQNGSLDTLNAEVPLLEASAASSPGVKAFSTESGPSLRVRRFLLKSLVRRKIRM